MSHPARTLSEADQAVLAQRPSYLDEAAIMRGNARLIGDWITDLANWAAEVARIASRNAEHSPEFSRISAIEYAQAMLRGYQAPGADPAEWAPRLAAALARMITESGEVA
jgi:hypothetical protein